MDYFWVKALHLIAVMSWMAGLLYLPRLFVYHAMVEAESVNLPEALRNDIRAWTDDRMAYYFEKRSDEDQAKDDER